MLFKAFPGERSRSVGPPHRTARRRPSWSTSWPSRQRDITKLTEILDTNGVAYTATNIKEDPAAQYAVRRDSHGYRLPVVFIVGECIGGRTELVNAASSGELRKKSRR